MFSSIGWPEIIVAALAALFIFGPERLPDLAKEAASGLKRVRTALTGIREQVNESLGDDLPELRNLDLRKYHPKTFIRDQLLGDDGPTVHRGSATAAGAAATIAGPSGMKPTGLRPAKPRPPDRSTPPPFDSDAT